MSLFVQLLLSRFDQNCPNLFKIIWNYLKLSKNILDSICLIFGAFLENQKFNLNFVTFFWKSCFFLLIFFIVLTHFIEQNNNILVALAENPSTWFILFNTASNIIQMVQT